MKDNLVNESGDLVNDTISRAAALNCVYGTSPNKIKGRIAELPPAQPELIEKTYIRGFKQGRTQGMIDSQGGKK